MRGVRLTRRVLVRRAALCLGAGAAITVLVAAGFALYAPLGSPSYVATQPFRRPPGAGAMRPPALQYPFRVPATWPQAPDSRIRIQSDGFQVDAWHASGPQVGDVSAAIYRSGWPMLAMERRQVRETRGAANRERWVVAGAGGIHAGLTVPGPLRPLLPPTTRPFRHRIPLAPVPLGFAVNTSLAAAALYTLLFARSHIVRARRRAAGLCIACGYDAGELGVCPECGEPSEQAGRRVSAGAVR